MLNSSAISASSGLSAFGFFRRVTTLSMTNLAFCVGTQLFSMAYVQISPVSYLIFGWKIFVLKRIFGHLKGYESEKSMLTLKTPPW